MTVSEGNKRLPFANVCGFAMLTSKFLSAGDGDEQCAGSWCETSAESVWQMALQMLPAADRVWTPLERNKLLWHASLRSQQALCFGVEGTERCFNCFCIFWVLYFNKTCSNLQRI